MIYAKLVSGKGNQVELSLLIHASYLSESRMRVRFVPPALSLSLPVPLADESIDTELAIVSVFSTQVHCTTM